MCGIVGYTGNKNAAEVLLNGLSRLEYRGYDSAGIAFQKIDTLQTIKTKGRISNLKAKVSETRIDAKSGIGHTRWATHGAPNDINSHPHSGMNNKVSIVHNGIVENYVELKEFLLAKGYTFRSETDSEVIANLLEYYFIGLEITEANALDSIRKALKLLKGSYALGIIFEGLDGSIFSARKDSPLVIGLGKNENFISSDIPAILTYTRKVIFLDDYELAVITRKKVTIYDLEGNMKVKKVHDIEWSAEAAEKGLFEHFMLKEIFEQPEMLKKAASSFESEVVPILEKFLPDNKAAGLNRIYISACGSAYHAGLCGKSAIEKLCGIEATVEIALEFRYREVSPGENDVCIFISQSGETIDTLLALRKAKTSKARILSIVNTEGSSLARESHAAVLTKAGPEIAVASTKAFGNQTAYLYMIALWIALKKEKISPFEYYNAIAEMKKLPVIAESLLLQQKKISFCADEISRMKSVFYIGRLSDYPLAMEGSLKLKEISYIPSEAYPAGELKHGSIALIEPGTAVVGIALTKELAEKMLSNIREVKTRGAYIVVLTQESISYMFENVADVLLTIPDLQSVLAPVVGVIPLQLLAYETACIKGLDVDKPRNLAKSVTVE